MAAACRLGRLGPPAAGPPGGRSDGCSPTFHPNVCRHTLSHILPCCPPSAQKQMDAKPAEVPGGSALAAAGSQAVPCELPASTHPTSAAASNFQQLRAQIKMLEQRLAEEQRQRQVAEERLAAEQERRLQAQESLNVRSLWPQHGANLPDARSTDAPGTRERSPLQGAANTHHAAATHLMRCCLPHSFLLRYPPAEGTAVHTDGSSGDEQGVTHPGDAPRSAGGVCRGIMRGLRCGQQDKAPAPGQHALWVAGKPAAASQPNGATQQWGPCA